MSKRNYTHVQVLLPKIQAMVKSGKIQWEIAEHDGFKDKLFNPIEELTRQNYGLAWDLLNQGPVGM